LDINHFAYFVTIVECDCNLSKAAKKIHISQSALSKILTTFEQEEGVLLFHRQNGRLNKLTEVGEIFLNACQDITSIYSGALKQIRRVSTITKGKVRVGIPPLIVTALFATCLSDFRNTYPEIDLDIIEYGAEELKRRFHDGELDFAVLLAPINFKTATKYALRTDELVAFVSKNHKFAEKESLSWKDLDKEPIAIFNESFSINRLLTERFEIEKISPNLVLKSGSWDFLIESVMSSDLITILPKPIYSYVYSDECKVVPIENAISWDVLFVEDTAKKPLTPAQTLFKNFILERETQQKDQSSESIKN